MSLFEDGKLRDDKKKKLMDQYPSLMEDDFEEENREKLIIHLQQKLGKTKEEMRDITRDL